MSHTYCELTSSWGPLVSGVAASTALGITDTMAGLIIFYGVTKEHPSPSSETVFSAHSSKENPE